MQCLCRYICYVCALNSVHPWFLTRELLNDTPKFKSNIQPEPQKSFFQVLRLIILLLNQRLRFLFRFKVLYLNPNVEAFKSFG